MSYKSGNYDGVVYVGNVKWSNDYTHVMLFDNITARNSFLTSHLTKIKNNIIYCNPNKYIDIDEKIKKIEQYNYIFFKNDSDVSNTYYCCFINDYEYISPNTTRLYIELDVFQMYHYTTDYFQSYIERAIISKSVDNQKNNYLPEPVSAPLIFESELDTVLTDTDWAPAWVLHSASYYEYSEHEYHYEGYGSNNTFGEYGRFIESKSELAQLLENYGRKDPEKMAQDAGISDGHRTWKDWVNALFAGGVVAIEDLYKLISTTSIADLQDHRDELIGLYAIPKWLKDAYISSGGDNNYADNRRVSKSVSLSINENSLANGYTPRNKKLLSSVCRAYVLANRNGLQIPFRPELFTGTPSITLYGITMSTGGYQFYITNYADYVKAYGEVAYNSERRVGYDANTGINKALAVIGAGSTISGVVGSVATGQPIGVLNAAGTIGQSLVSAIDQLGTREAHFGNNGDLLRITGGRPALRWYELNPTVSECQAIDNFFDMYGYSIQKHQNPTSYMSTRPVWNYVKTNNINLRGRCPSNYENKLKNIYNAGVTIWHNYDSFGNYSIQNW